MKKLELNENVYCMLTKISPNLNIKTRYSMIYKRIFPMNNPKTFVEKVLWLRMKYYNKSTFVANCADKVTVRKYVADKGYGRMLNDIYGIYDDVSEFLRGGKSA
jgi:hypothetical protein